MADKTVKSAVKVVREPPEGGVVDTLPLKERLLRKKARISETARAVLAKRYLRKDDKGQPTETPEDMLFRVAENIASAETKFSTNGNPAMWTERFYDVMVDLDFLPNSPTLMNAGRELQQLSACFVLPVGDSMEEIFTSVKNTALIHKSGGGTGFSFSNIRPKNDIVRSTKGISSGPLSFMRVFDVATETVKQGGTRRGANMGILNCSHPEIMDFVEMKEKDGELSNFNISVGITNEFMEALKRDEEYPLRNPRTGDVVGRLKASTVYKRITELAWKNGEPGVVFLDKVNENNPTPHIGRIESTNPCGEQPLLPYESCNLGSINLAQMISTDKDGKRVIDYDKLGETVAVAVRFLDNVIEVNNYPIPEIEEMTRGNRKIGLGVMGFADLLVAMGIPYNSHAAANTAEQVMAFIQKESRKVSAFLAQERGVFPNFEGSAFDTMDGLKVRNATTTTIAPTGTISMIAGCSSGVEPLFAVVYEKNVLEGEHFLEVHPGFEETARKEGFYSDELMKMVAETGSLRKIYGIPKRIRDVFVTSHDTEPRWHVTIQASFQKYTDNAVSKTVNFRNDATVADVEEAYRLAYDLNCKGVTVYRDGSRRNQVMTTGTTRTQSAAGAVVMSGNIVPRPRPSATRGRTYKTKTGCGNLYVNVNTDEFGFCELFTQMGKSGGCAASNSEALARVISNGLRAGIDPKVFVEQLRGIRCPVPTWSEGEMILSCADAVGRVLEKAIADLQGQHTAVKALLPSPEKAGANGNPGSATSATVTMSADLGYCPQCPECGGMMEHEGGCNLCRSCGFSKCG